MADPTPYTPGYDFSDFQAGSPNRPLPGDRVDTELANVAEAIGQTIDGLKDIRRSDGKLKNGIVTADAIVLGGVAAGAAIVWDGAKFISGPIADEISNAQGYAETAQTASEAASLSAAVAAQAQVFARGPTPVEGAGMFGGVIRNDGSGWAPIIDANHSGVVGMSASVAVEDNRIILTPSPAATKNITNLWTVDETFATHGVFVGASSGVGPSGQTQLVLASPASLRIAMGAPPTFALGNSAHANEMTVHWALASYTVTGAAGSIAVGDTVACAGISCTVTFVDGARIDVAGRNNSTDKYQPLPATGVMTTAGGYSATISGRTIIRGLVIRHLPVATNNGVTANYDASVQPRFVVDFAVHQVSSTETRLLPYGPSLPAQIYLDTDGAWKSMGGTGVGGLDRERNGSNAWSFTWNAGQNALDVIHPEVVDPWDIAAQSQVAGVQVQAIPLTATSARVRFSLTTTGATIAPENTPSTSFNFNLRRGRFPLYNLWTGHVRVNFPVLQLNPSRVSNSIGNLWGFGLFNEANPNAPT